MVWNVYKHIAPNGKVYIGITSQPCNKRWRNGKGYKHNQHFSSAIKEFGWEDIKHEVLYENIPQEEAQRIEKKLINEYNPIIVNLVITSSAVVYCTTPQVKKQSKN